MVSSMVVHDKILKNIELAKFTSIKIGGQSKLFFEPQTIDEFVDAIEYAIDNTIPYFILGGGSNLLISSDGFEGLVIRTTKLSNISQLSENTLIAQCGVRLPHIARFAANLNLSGLEFSCGIPGTIGGGVIMNAGAHGSSMSNLVDTVRIYDVEARKILKLRASELAFEYRRCKLDPYKHIILEAQLNLVSGDKQSILDKIKANEDYRWKTQPLSFPNAGSTFKNHSPTQQAGLLLDKSGSKNLRVGNAGVSAIHANFVVNLGEAKSNDVVELLYKMQNNVLEKFDILLKPEWKTLGSLGEISEKVWR